MGLYSVFKYLWCILVQKFCGQCVFCVSNFIASRVNSASKCLNGYIDNFFYNMPLPNLNECSEQIVFHFKMVELANTRSHTFYEFSRVKKRVEIALTNHIIPINFNWSCRNG